MGLDPHDNSYPTGTECSVCVDVLFGGSTPSKVLAIVQGISRCPGIPVWAPDPPAGPFCLPQIAACEWSYTLGSSVNLKWTLLANASVFSITYPGFFYFHDSILTACQDSFTNQNSCGSGPTWGEGGTVDVFWGPQICKEPCS